MKLDKWVLLEVMDIVRSGLTEQKDVSDLLRNIDLVEDEPGLLTLSKKYVDSKIDAKEQN